jgi:hypothetical protein
VLVNLSALAPEVCREHYRVPIACTSAVWALIDRAIKNPRWSNDLNGVVHDILWMSRKVSRTMDASTVEVSAIITGAGRRRLHHFKLIVGPGDQGEPVGTIMLPSED